ncbi:MAG TPA: sensor histidine kinase [Rhizomicrobium sp.]|nr:sensor histidine kinase [Rhizomicrobium sp.]
MVHRIAGLDIPRRLAGVAPAWATKIACACLGVGFAVSLRAITNLVAPGVAPYAFIYPASLLATLLGGWQAGAGTVAVAGFLAWVFVVPDAALSGGQMHYQVAAALIAALTCAMLIAVGEGIRAAARRLAEERNAKLAERELLLRELEHRVGNDFAIVNSLLDLQRRRSSDPQTRGALEQAMGRIRSISRIHRQIYALPDISHVDLRQYLRDLCNGLREATLPPAGIKLDCACEQAFMTRDHALALGLAANELITNAVKHAFPDGREGAIAVAFARVPQGWRLTVSDDGVGLPPGPRKTGLGTGLIEQFVRQVSGTLTLTADHGTQAVVDLPPGAASSSAG